MIIDIYSKTDIGNVRTSNQDSMASGRFQDGNVWAIVCDGMGGANGGNIASSIAVESIASELEKLYSSDMDYNSIQNMLDESINAANKCVYDKSVDDISLDGMGTTVVASVIIGNTAHISHVGDSRVYCVSKEGAKQLTTDHSMVQTMVDKGQISQIEARNHPKKNVITRAVGVMRQVLTDYCRHELEQGDILILCSDGLSNYFEDSELFESVANTPQEEIASKLVETAKERGGTDNITVIVLCAK